MSFSLSKPPDKFSFLASTAFLRASSIALYLLPTDNSSSFTSDNADLKSPSISEAVLPMLRKKDLIPLSEKSAFLLNSISSDNESPSAPIFSVASIKSSSDIPSLFKISLFDSDNPEILLIAFVIFSRSGDIFEITL